MLLSGQKRRDDTLPDQPYRLGRIGIQAQRDRPKTGVCKRSQLVDLFVDVVERTDKRHVIDQFVQHTIRYAFDLGAAGAKRSPECAGTAHDQLDIIGLEKLSQQPRTKNAP